MITDPSKIEQLVDSILGAHGDLVSGHREVRQRVVQSILNTT